MKSLAYLLVRQFVNFLKELRKRPAQLILIVLLLVMMLFSFFGVSGPNAQELLRDRRELEAIVLLLYAVVFTMNCLKGVDGGASFYSMADLQLLFPAPYSNMTMLFYGLFRQLGTSFFMGLVIVYQYANLRIRYGITFAELLLILFGFGLTVFSSQVTAMCFYSFTSGRERRQNFLQMLIYFIVGFYIVYALQPLLTGGSLWVESLQRLGSALAASFPVAGWLKIAVFAVVGGGYAGAALSLLAVVLWNVLALRLITRFESDFYEDVLLATEVSHTAITARKEGTTRDYIPRHVRLGQTGLEQGWGASAFFRKHLIENRRGGFLMLDANTLVSAVMTVGLAYFMREMGLIYVIGFTSYFQLIMQVNAPGRWMKELLLPYVYLTPEPPFKKLICICLEQLPKAIIEAMLIYLPIAVLFGLAPLEALCCLLLRISFSCLFLAIRLLTERVIGSSAGRMLLMIAYLFLALLILLPGIIVAAVILASWPGAALVSGMSLAFLAFSLVNLLLTLLLFSICRDMLEIAELNNR